MTRRWVRNAVCSIPGCHERHEARGWCNKHYLRWKRHGNPLGWGHGLLWDRFWNKVDASGDCWEWIGATAGNGYGKINVKGRDHYPEFAHRVGWELLVGPIPDGLVIDHLCRNTLCVNPDHLEPVTHKVNVRRGYRYRGRAAA
ncbi:MAG TPA: HNH endonuclease signature motif containing protein [Acidimicrobiia bacterium]